MWMCKGVKNFYFVNRFREWEDFIWSREKEPKLLLFDQNKVNVSVWNQSVCIEGVLKTSTSVRDSLVSQSLLVSINIWRSFALLLHWVEIGFECEIVSVSINIWRSFALLLHWVEIGFECEIVSVSINIWRSFALLLHWENRFECENCKSFENF